MPSCTKGGSARLDFRLYTVGGALADPDGYPSAPAFGLYLGETLVEGFERMRFTTRSGVGLYSLDIVIPTATKGAVAAFEAGSYTVRLVDGAVDGTALVAQGGGVPSVALTVVPDYATVQRRPYATPTDLSQLYDLPEDLKISEITRAQGVIDSFMHRSLWPTIYQGERHQLPAGRNVTILDVRPIIQLIEVRGRQNYASRDRVGLSSISSELALLSGIGAVPQWVTIDVSLVSVNPRTGELWVPTGIIPYSEIEVTYLAGYQQIPDQALDALAMVIDWTRFKGYEGLQSYGTGKVSRSTGESFLSESTRAKLTPYRVVPLR